MSSEDMARRFIETLLIDIHWDGVRSEHPHDVKWLESRVKSLLPKAMIVIESALSLRENAVSSPRRADD